MSLLLLLLLRLRIAGLNGARSAVAAQRALLEDRDVDLADLLVQPSDIALLRASRVDLGREAFRGNFPRAIPRFGGTSS